MLGVIVFVYNLSGGVVATSVVAEWEGGFAD